MSNCNRLLFMLVVFMSSKYDWALNDSYAALSAGSEQWRAGEAFKDKIKSHRYSPGDTDHVSDAMQTGEKTVRDMKGEQGTLTPESSVFHIPGEAPRYDRRRVRLRYELDRAAERFHNRFFNYTKHELVRIYKRLCTMYYL